jgi:hypothetical protein
MARPKTRTVARRTALLADTRGVLRGCSRTATIRLDELELVEAGWLGARVPSEVSRLITAPAKAPTEPQFLSPTRREPRDPTYSEANTKPSLSISAPFRP